MSHTASCLTLPKSCIVLVAAAAFLVASVAAAAAQEVAPPDLTVVGTGSTISTEVAAGAEQSVGDDEATDITGADAFARAAAVAEAFPPGLATVYVATGEVFADALSGGPLAALQAGPILLVQPDGVPEPTVDALERLTPGRIVVLGGPAAISADVIAELETFTPGGASRLAGANRWATAAAVSQAGWPDGAETVYVATGAAFPDALTGGVAAALADAPMLLVRQADLPQETADELARLAPAEIVILGGTAAIEATVEDALEDFGAVRRLAGPNRFATAVEVAEDTFDMPAAIYLATGEEFADALVTVPVAAGAGDATVFAQAGTAGVGPIVLAEQDRLPDETSAFLERVASASGEQNGDGDGTGGGTNGGGGPVNEAPTAVDDAYATDEDAVLNEPAPGVLTGDSDPEGGALTVTAFDAASVQGAAVTVSADGSFSYDPTGAAALQGLAAAATVDDTFTYTISDPAGRTSTATVTVTVSGIDDAPTAVDDTSTVDEDSGATTIDVQANDTDAEGDAFAITLVTQPANGTVVITNAGADLTYEPDPDYCNDGTPTDDFTYTITGGDTGSVEVTVTCVNDDPVADNEVFSNLTPNTEHVVEAAAPETAAATGPIAQTVAGNLLIGDSDPVEGSAVAIQQVGADATAPFDAATTLGGAVTVFADGSFVYAPEAGDAGAADSFTYTIADADGGTDTGTVTLNLAADLIWYVDNDDAASDDTGSGTSTAPFTSLVDVVADGDADDAEDAAGAGDTIYVFDSSVAYPGGITLQQDQTLLGEGVALPNPRGGADLAAAGGQPDVTSTGAAVTIPGITGAEVAGLDLQPTDGDGVSIDATSADIGAWVHDLSITTTTSGDGVDLGTTPGRTAEIALADLTITAAGEGIDLNGRGGATTVVTAMTDIDVTSATGGGITADFTTFDADTGTAGFQTVAGGDSAVGDPASVTDIDGPGLRLDQVRGALDFGDLDIGADGDALFVQDADGKGGTFTLDTDSGDISALNGTAIDIDPVTLGNGGADVMTLTSVRSDTTSGTTSAGINLDTVSGALSITGTTLISSAGGGSLTDGITISHSTADVTLSGALTIANTTDAGIDLDAHFGNLSITDAASTISGTVGDAFRSISGGGGITYAGTISNAAGNAVDIVSHGGAAASTITFSGAIDDDGAGINLSDNDQGAGATVTFSGGLDLDTGTSTAFSATAGGTVNVTSGSVSTTADTTTGTVVDIVNTLIGGSGITFDATSSTGGSDGIRLTNTGAGAFTTLGGNIANQTSRGVDIAGGSGNITINASISTTTTGRSVEMTTRTGGTVDVNGTIDDNGLGIRLENNVGATMRFDGGMAVTTAAGSTDEGFQATGGGTVHATGTNTVDTSNGTGAAINIAGGTTIGTSGTTFQAVSANGAASGIILSATGTDGGFSVTGTGSSGSGGTITATGSDAITLTNVDSISLSDMILGDATASAGQAPDGTSAVLGDGIALSTVDDLTLDGVRIARTAGHGIDGTGVTGMTLTDVTILNAGDGNDEHGLAFDGVGSNNLDGTVTLTDVVVDGSSNRGMFVQNSSGSLLLNVSGTTPADCRFANTTGSAFGEDGINIDARGSASTTVTIDSCTFEDLEGDGVRALAQEGGGAQLDVTVQGSDFVGCAAGTCSANGSDNAMSLRSAGTAQLAIDLLRNDISSNNTAVLLESNNTATLTGTVDDNDIGIAATPDSGSITGRGIDLFTNGSSTSTVAITNNTITGTDLEGIIAFTEDFAGGTPVMNLTITDNDVATPDDNSAPGGVPSVHVTGRDSSSVCVDLRTNVVGAGTSGFDALLVRQRETSTFQVERLTPGAQSAAATATHVASENPSAAGVTATADSTFTGVADNTCPQP